MWGVTITSDLELELVLSQNREREALMSHVSTHFIIRNEAVCRHGDWILSTDWLLWTWVTVSENQRMILSVISHSAWSCWTENTTEAECKHWPLVVLTRAPLSSVTGGWTAENTEVRGQRSGPLWPHTTHSNLRTCREFRLSRCLSSGRAPWSDASFSLQTVEFETKTSAGSSLTFCSSAPATSTSCVSIQRTCFTVPTWSDCDVSLHE